MSKKKRKKQDRQLKASDKSGANPDPLDTIEIATSLWVLTLAFLTVGNLLMLIAYWVVAMNPDWETIDALYRVSVLGNMVITVVSLILLTIVLRRRPVAPPRAVTIYGVIVCFIPAAMTLNILL